jgi:AraC-like DNA-binding protein
MTEKYVFSGPLSREPEGRWITDGFRKIMSRQATDADSFSPPDTAGKGRCIRLASKDPYSIYLYELRLRKNVLLSAATEGPVYVLQFCMEADAEWQEKESGARLRLQQGQGAFSFIRRVSETCEYQEGLHYKGFRISFSESRIESLAEGFGVSANQFSRRKSGFSISYFEITPECRIAIEQIVRCRYSGAVGALYIDSKVNEILAYSMASMQDRTIDEPDLSKGDVEGLVKAKEILDNHISAPVTIHELSRMVYLNEHKLKNGFKRLFGKPVHSYLLDRRMEQARLLLEKGSLCIYEVAELVGYSDGSSFSKAFYKRYGYRPAECARREIPIGQ